MSFLNPIMLWGLVLLSVPIAIHLLRKPKAKKYQWAAMQFLSQKKHESTYPRSLNQWLALLLRLLTILLLIFAVSRPVLTSWFGTDDRIENVIVLLDRSALTSTTGESGKTQLAASIEVLKRRLKTLDARVQLHILDSTTEQLTPLSSDFSLLEKTQPTALRGRLPVMMTKAHSEIHLKELAKVEIWIVSGHDSTTWNPNHTIWSGFHQRSIDALGNAITYRHLTTNLLIKSKDDRSLRLIESERITSDSGDLLKLKLQLCSHSDALVPVELKWSRLGGYTEEHLVELSPTREDFTEWISIDLSDTAESGGGKVSLPSDANSANNTIYYAYGPTKQLKTVIVSSNPTDEATLAFYDACSLPSQPNQKASLISPEDFLHLDLSKTAFVIWLSPSGNIEMKDRLTRFAENGGSVLICPNDQSASDRWYFAARSSAALGEYFTVKPSQTGTGPWRTSADKSLPLNLIRAVQKATLKPSSENEILAQWSDDTALLTRRLTGKGRIYLLSTRPDFSWSNLEETALHLIFTQRVLTDWSRKNGGGLLREWSHADISKTRERVPLQDREGPTELFQSGLFKIDGELVALNAAVTTSQSNLSDSEITTLLAKTQSKKRSSTLSNAIQSNGIYFFLLIGLFAIVFESILPALLSKTRSATVES